MRDRELRKFERRFRDLQSEIERSGLLWDPDGEPIGAEQEFAVYDAATTVMQAARLLAGADELDLAHEAASRAVYWMQRIARG